MTKTYEKIYAEIYIGIFLILLVLFKKLYFSNLHGKSFAVAQKLNKSNF